MSLQAFLPPMDVRASYAMETHGVMQTRLVGPPASGGILNPPSGGPDFLQGNFFKFLPILLLLGVYGAVQFANWLKVVLLPATSSTEPPLFTLRKSAIIITRISYQSAHFARQYICYKQYWATQEFLAYHFLAVKLRAQIRRRGRSWRLLFATSLCKICYDSTSHPL